MFETLKKYFIPHEGNDHRPHLLRPKAVLFICVVTIVAESAFLVGSSLIIPRSRLFGIIVVNALIDGTNQARTTDGLTSLRESGLLDVAAEEKANDMVANNYFAHTSPSGVTPWYWFWNAGYNFSAAGENLAVNFADSSDVTSAWMNSPEHRANILNPEYSEIGMATAQGEFQGQPAVYVVELFGTPAAPAPALAPVATAQAAALPTRIAAKVPSGTGIASSLKTQSKPAPKPAAMPLIVTTTNSTAVAIQGAATQAASATAPAPAPSPASVVLSATAASAPQTNLVQQAVADPRQTVDYIYFVIALLFAVALALNIFVKIHIQHPQVILGGMLVILLAGLLVVLNQHFGALGVMII